jgi:hypothetical protein
MMVGGFHGRMLDIDLSDGKIEEFGSRKMT